MSDDDLYDDLDRKLPASEEAIRSSHDTTVRHYKAPSSSTTNRRPKSFVDEVKDLQERVEVLENENRTLRRNMGTLYRTAVAELKRKDAQIEELQMELSKPPAPSS